MMARGSIERYERKDGGVSWRLRYVTGYDARGNPIHARKTVRGTKREAEAELRRLMSDIDRGTRVEPSQETTGQFIGRWLATHQQGLSPTTAQRYRFFVDGHIIPGLGAVPLQKLTALQVQEFITDRLEAGGSPKSVRDCILLLKQALAQAVDWGLLAENPAAKVRLPRVERREVTVLTPEQAQVALSALVGSYAWMPAMIAYHTGARMGETLALSWDAVNLDEKTIEIRRSYTLHGESGPIFQEPKTRAGRRTVEIGDTLAMALREQRKAQAQLQLSYGGAWRDEHGLVCTLADGGFIRAKNLANLFRRRTRGAGLDVTFHVLRHTHVSLLIRAGVPINVISERVGHASPSITHDIYAHLLPGMGRDAADRFEELSVTRP